MSNDYKNSKYLNYCQLLAYKYKNTPDSVTNINSRMSTNCTSKLSSAMAERPRDA